MPLSVEIPAPVRTQMRPALVSQSGTGSVTPVTLGARVPGRPAVSQGAHDPSPSPGRAGPAPTGGPSLQINACSTARWTGGRACPRGGVSAAARAVESTAVTAADASGAGTLPAALRDRRAPGSPGSGAWGRGCGRRLDGVAETRGGF